MQLVALITTYRPFTQKLECFDKILGNKNSCQDQSEEKLNVSTRITNLKPMFKIQEEHRYKANKQQKGHDLPTFIKLRNYPIPK